MTEVTKACPYCGEQILAVAIKCKHCASQLDVPAPAVQAAPAPASTTPIRSKIIMERIGIVLVFMAVVLVFGAEAGGEASVGIFGFLLGWAGFAVFARGFSARKGKRVGSLLCGVGGFAAMVIVARCIFAIAPRHQAPATPAVASTSFVPAEAPAPQPIAAPAAATPAARIGDIVPFADSNWTVISARDAGKKLASNNMFQEPATTADGRFIVVQFRVTNRTSKGDSIFDGPKVVDDQGREFPHVERESFYIPKGAKTMAMETLPPSLGRTFWGIYEVAADSTGLKFQTRPLAPFGDKKLVELDL